jgi:hypothetical protein
MPSLVVLSVICILLFAALFLALKHAIASAKEHGQLEKEIKDARQENEIQQEYGKIASRPKSTADDIIDRMRGNKPANK